MTATGGMSQFEMFCAIDPCVAHFKVSKLVLMHFCQISSNFNPLHRLSPLHFPLLWPPLQELTSEPNHHNPLLLSILLNLNPPALDPTTPSTHLLFQTLNPLFPALLDVKQHEQDFTTSYLLYKFSRDLNFINQIMYI